MGAQGAQTTREPRQLGSPDNSGAQTTREPRQLGSPGNSEAQENVGILRKKITLKIALFDPNFPYRSPKSQENTGGGWVGKKIWERSPKKTLFFYAFPNM